MKFQLNVVLQVLKKIVMWLFILILFFFSFIMMYTITISPRNFTVEFLELVGFPGKKYFDIYTLLQLLLNSLIIYRYYTYEVNNSFENVVLRSSDKKWFCYKLIGLLFGVIFVRLVFWALAYLFYHGLITIRLSYFIYPIIHHFLVGIIIITICNLFKNQIMRFILIIIFSILTSIYFHLWYIIILIGLIILNYRDFNFQRLQ